MFGRELRFQVRDDSVPTPPPPQKEVSIQQKSLTPKKLAAIQKCEKLSALKSQHACMRDFLNRNMFLNWHFLTPDFQLLLLQRLIDFYDSKA